MASTNRTKRKSHHALVVKDSHKHIYYGIGTLSVILLGAFIVYRMSKQKRVATILNNKGMDFSIFDSPDVPGSGNCIDRNLVLMLQELEEKTGYPIFAWINSGVRSNYWNSKVGGVSNSSHRIPTCKAVDIKTPNKLIRYRLVMAAHKVGFKRIGVGKTFVHLDIDSSKSQFVAWGYPSGTPAEVNPFV